MWGAWSAHKYMAIRWTYEYDYLVDQAEKIWKKYLNLISFSITQKKKLLKILWKPTSVKADTEFIQIFRLVKRLCKTRCRFTKNLWRYRLRKKNRYFDIMLMILLCNAIDWSVSKESWLLLVRHWYLQSCTAAASLFRTTYHKLEEVEFSS